MLRVLNVAYRLVPVRPHTAGGAEQLVFMLDRELTAAGDRSFVLACHGSQVAGTMIPSRCPTGPLTEFVSQNVRIAYREALAEAGLPAHAIENAIAEGFTHADFLGGAEADKYLWGAKDPTNFSVRPETNNSKSKEPQAS